MNKIEKYIEKEKEFKEEKQKITQKIGKSLEISVHMGYNNVPYIELTRHNRRATKSIVSIYLEEIEGIKKALTNLTENN